MLYSKKNDISSNKVDASLSYSITSIDNLQKVGIQNFIFHTPVTLETKIMQRINTTNKEITIEKSKPVSLVSGIPCPGLSKENWRYKLIVEFL